MTGLRLCDFFDGSTWKPTVLHQRTGLALMDQFWTDRYLVLASVLPREMLQYFQAICAALGPPVEPSRIIVVLPRSCTAW
jgi:hypothetical protein